MFGFSEEGRTAACGGKDLGMYPLVCSVVTGENDAVSVCGSKLLCSAGPLFGAMLWCVWLRSQERLHSSL